MPYCCREHQISDRNNHKVDCSAVKKCKKNLEREEQKLRKNVPEEGADHFSEVDETHPYMLARHRLVDKLLNIRTYDAAKAAFNHFMEMTRLCRGINAFQFIVPALFIRLGKIQECYDFLKWYATTGSREDYDWENMNQTYLDVRDADVFESIAEFTAESADVGYILPLMLIKMRLLMDIKSLQNSDFLDELEMLPPEMVDRIRKEVAGKIVSKRTGIFMIKEQDRLIEKLEQQMRELYIFANKKIERFWARLLIAEDYLSANPSACNIGLKLFYYHDALLETPGSIDMIKEWVRKDGHQNE